MFPKVDMDKILIVPTCQHAAMDLVRVGEDVDTEKDVLLERVRWTMLAITCWHAVA